MTPELAWAVAAVGGLPTSVNPCANASPLSRHTARPRRPLGNLGSINPVCPVLGAREVVAVAGSPSWAAGPRSAPCHHLRSTSFREGVSVTHPALPVLPVHLRNRWFTPGVPDTRPVVTTDPARYAPGSQIQTKTPPLSRGRLRHSPRSPSRSPDLPVLPVHLRNRWFTPGVPDTRPVVTTDLARYAPGSGIQTKTPPLFARAPPSLTPLPFRSPALPVLPVHLRNRWFTPGVPDTRPVVTTDPARYAPGSGIQTKTPPLSRGRLRHSPRSPSVLPLSRSSPSTSGTAGPRLGFRIPAR